MQGSGAAGQTGTDQTGTDETLADAFRSVSRQLRETSQETLAPWDINPSQFRALRVLNHHGAIRLSDLSGRLHIAPRSATEVVERPRVPRPGRTAARPQRPAGHTRRT